MTGLPDLWDLRGTPSDEPMAETERRIASILAAKVPTSQTVVSWVAVGFEGQVPTGTTYQMRRCLQSAFKPYWLVLSTPGFDIEKLTIGNRYMFLEKLDGDLFLWSNWDKLVAADQLDRVRIGGTERWDVGHQVTLSVTARRQLVTFRGEERPFRAMILGEELTLRQA